MASFFNKAVKNVGTSNVVAFQSQTDSTIVLSILCSSTGGANIDITCERLNSSNASVGFVGKTLVIPANANLDLIGNKFILPSGDKLAFLASTSGGCDVFVSYVEV